ncbi:MAG: hypothetical protein U0401_05780 [Anaerolineae bacterium]
MAARVTAQEKGGRNGSASVLPRSHLFTVRLWAEEIGGGQTEWRGRVQSITGGEARYFRDWPILIAHLQQMLPQTKAHLEASRASKPSKADDNGELKL